MGTYTEGQRLQSGKRIVVSEFGQDPVEAIEKYASIVDMDPPDISSLQANEVVVEIKSAAVGWVDMLMTSGQYQHMPKPPYTPGIEYSGVVSWVGSAVDKSKAAIGDRVLVDWLLAGARSHGKYQSAGGFASYAVVPEEAVLPIPDGFSFDEACCLLGSYETAYHCLIARGQLRAGETVLITGASGAAGMAAVQVAKIVGATVIATGRSARKLASVKSHGADHVIDTSSPDLRSAIRPFRDEVKALTGGRGANVVYDTVGGDTSRESLRCLAFGGRFLIVGWASTPNVARGKGQRGSPNANHLPTNVIQMKSLSVLGCPAAIAVEKDPAIRPPRVAQIMQWVRDGLVRPSISHVYPLAQFKEAMLARWNGDVTGGCVLHPSNL